MRKLLLGGAATLALLASTAALRAQTADLGGDTLTDSDDDGQTLVANPKPGTVAVRLNGRFRFYTGMWDDQQFNRTTTSTTYALVPGASGVTSKATTSTSINKQSDYGATEYLRLYPGFDGLTTGGLKYGFTAEIRQDNLVAPGNGVNSSISGADRARGALYVRRDWGYIGTDQLGTLRFGTEDGATSLFLTGTFENFNDGGWNGDVYYGLATNAQLVWPFEDSGNVYSTTKIIYLSPKIAGFDFGASWEPSTAGANIDDGNCSAAGTSNTLGVTSGSNTIGTVPANSGFDFGGVGCDRLSSTTTAAESGRRRNTFDFVGRYRGTLGPVGIVGTAGYIGGSHVNYVGPYYTSSTSSVTKLPIYTRPVTYNGLSVGDFGLAVTFAGLQVGGHYMYGKFNNSLASGSGAALALAPVGAKDAAAWVAGASYTIGPVIVGGAWVDVSSAGAFSYSAGSTPVLSQKTPGLGERREQGVQAGGTLKVAPGLGVFVSYLWDQRKQSGFDFVSGAIGEDTNNKVRAQALTLGTSLTW